MQYYITIRVNWLTMIAVLSPTTCPSKGAPKQEANAICGLSVRAITVLDTQSATELPIARTVSPRIAV